MTPASGHLLVGGDPAHSRGLEWDNLQGPFQLKPSCDSTPTSLYPTARTSPTVTYNMRMFIKWQKQNTQGQRDPMSPQRMLSQPRVDSRCCHHRRQQCYFMSWERHLGSLSPNSHLSPGHCWQCSSRKNPVTDTRNPWEQKPALSQFTCLMRAGWAPFAYKL